MFEKGEVGKNIRPQHSKKKKNSTEGRQKMTDNEEKVRNKEKERYIEQKKKSRKKYWMR